MHGYKWKIIGLAVLFALGGFVMASAQTDEAAPRSAVDLDAQLAEEGMPDASQIERLSGQEKLAQAQTSIGEMRQTLGEINQLLEESRRAEQDILKINCINEKLVSVKGFLKVSEQEYVNLKDAVSRDDSSAANHHYTLIAIADTRVDSLAQEARVCVGEVQRYADETQLLVEVDSEIAAVDPIGDYVRDFPLDDDWVILGRPPEATPFQ